MAARRLIILMLLVLAVSTVAAALAPQRDTDDDASTSSTTTTTEPDPPPSTVGGELVEATIDADAEEPETIEVELGDQIALVVETAVPAQIEVPDFGLLEDAESDAPARFDLLATRSGEFPVVLTTSETAERVVGSLVVSEGAADLPRAS